MSTARFAELVRQPDCALDVGALLIAAHARPSLDIELCLAQLDDLAERSGADDVDALCEFLFDGEGFAGNHADYYAPANSYLDQVLDRRLGIPITLAVVLIEVGRRRGLDLQGVAMPGHFLVRVPAGPRPYIDPFNGGERLDPVGCERLLARLQGQPVTLHPSWLAPVDHRSVLWRMLENLKAVHSRRNDPMALEWVLRLRCAFPTAGDEERAEHERILRLFN